MAACWGVNHRKLDTGLPATLTVLFSISAEVAGHVSAVLAALLVLSLLVLLTSRPSLRGAVGRGSAGRIRAPHLLRPMEATGGQNLQLHPGRAVHMATHRTV